jgi:hypothetical protein
MKKIIIPVILFVIIIIGVSCFMLYSKAKNVEEVTNENVVDTKTNIETDKTVTESSDKKFNEIENTNELTNSSAIKESKSEEKKEEKKSEENKNNNIKQNTTVVEEPKSENKKTAWDELGISEYDYYHKPMWNWQRIDFSIDEYKTEQKTKEACISKGNEYFEQGIGYSCSSVTSYAGTYLGEMLKTF